MKKVIGISIFVFTTLCIIFLGLDKINAQAITNDVIVINGNWDWDKEVTMGSVIEILPSFKVYSVSQDYKIGFKLVGQDGSVLLDELVSPGTTSKWSGTKQWLRNGNSDYYRSGFVFNVPKIASAPFKSKYKVLAGLSNGANFIPLIPNGTIKASNVYTNMYEIGDVTVYNSPVTVKQWTGPKTAIVGSDLKLNLNFEGGPTDKDYYVGVIFSDFVTPYTNRFYTSILPEIKTSNWSGKISVPITVKVPDNLPFDNLKLYSVKVVLSPTKLTGIPPKSSYPLTPSKERISSIESDILPLSEFRSIEYPNTPVYTVGFIKFQKVTPPVPISVVYPNGNERIKIGDEFDVKWTGKNFPSDAYVHISLVNEDGKEVDSFGKSPSRGNGSEKISILGSHNDIKPGQYKIRLECTNSIGRYCSDFPTSEDYSDSFFTLLSANATNTNSTVPVTVNPPNVPVINSQQPVTINQWYVYSSHSGSVATAKPSTENNFSSINYSISFKGGPTTGNNNVFVHFVDGNGKIVLTSDLTPEIPSSKWNTNSVNFVSADVEVPINMQPGTYKVMAGLYNKNGRVSLNPGPGVLAADAENRYQIGTVNILKAGSVGLQSYRRNDAVTAPDSETVNNVSPSVSVIKPIKNSVFKIGDTVTTSWSNQNVEADYFYILLENTALKDVGFIVKDNLSGVSSTSFALSSALAKVISLNTPNLNENQINGRYFVRVVAMKKATPYDKVVSSGTSDLFSINSGNNTPAVIYVTAPSGGQIMKNSGSNVIIGWKHTAATDHEFGINLLKVNGDLAANIKTCSTSSNKTQEPGSLDYSWRNGYDAYGKEIPNGRYTILVYDCAGITVSGQSNNSFELISGNNTGTTTSTTTTPYLEIVSPVGNRTYQFGSRIYIAWNVRNADANYYYALLENTAIKDYGFVVADNIPLSTTTTSFIFNKNVLDTMLSSRFGLTEAQLQNGYYVRIIGVKKDFPNSNAVINATSGTFSISNSSDLVVSNTFAKLGSPVIANNITVAYPYEMNLTITNYSNDAVYIRNKGDGNDVVSRTLPSTATSTSPFISASPESLSGDGTTYLVIPAGISRKITYYGSLKNDGPISNVTHEITGIVYGKSNAWPQGYIISLPQGSLKISTAFGTGKSETLPVISSINPSSGTTGTIVVLKGKNLAGFEGDLDAWIKDSKGQVAYLPSYGKLQANQITVAIPDKACKANNSYSGLPCKEYLPIVPGNYKIFTNPWGNLSNEVYFTVTNDSTPSPTPTNTSVIPSSDNSMRVISPNGGEVLKKGSFVNIYYNKKPNDGSYRTDMYLIADSSQSVYTIQGKAGGTGIYDPSLGDSVVMYGWTVGEGSIINGTPTSNIPTGYYRLKVCLTGTSVCDLSDRAFAITETSTPTPTPVYSSTPTVTPAPTYGSTPTPTPVYSSTPSPTYSSTPTATPTPVYSSTPIPTYSSTPTVTPAPIYGSTPTPTPVYSSSPSTTPAPTYGSTPTPTPTPSSSSSGSPRPSSSPTAFMIDQNSLNASIWSIVKNLFSIE